MSEDVERRLLDVLDNPTASPYGNPIPGLDRLGVAPAQPDETVIRLSSLPPDESTAVVVRQLAEYVQTDPDLMTELRGAGVVPDARITVRTARDGSASVTATGHQDVKLSEEMAHAVLVKLA